MTPNLILRIPVLLAFLLGCSAVLAAPPDHLSPIPWKALLFGVMGGLAFFLMGMHMMSHGLKKGAGNRMRMILQALTRHRIIALLVGAFVTMVIQSSSATTVMLVSFVQAGLMNFAQTLGVIMGAGIGTTVTAQLIAFKLTDYALLMVALGFALRALSKRPAAKTTGEIILGFGILFFGMHLMSDAMKPLRTYPAFLDIMKNLEHPAMGILAGALFTALIQSSSASTGVVIVLAQQGLISLEAGIPIIFGANIGTCVTAGLASIGASRDAKRVAIAHVLFKVTGVLLFIFWIPEFADLIRDLAAPFGSGTARQIANAHTLFNVSLGLAFLPFTGLFAALILKLFPDKPIQEPLTTFKTHHIDPRFITTPAVALDLTRAELSRMAKLLVRMLRGIIIPFISDARHIATQASSPGEAERLIQEIPTRDARHPELSLLEGIDMREKKIDYLDEQVQDYLFQVARGELSQEQVAEVYGMVSISNDLEAVGDIIHRNMVPLIKKKEAVKEDFTEEGKEEIMIYHHKVVSQVQLLREAFAERDLVKAQQIMAREKTVLDLDEQYRIQHLERLLLQNKASVETHEVHMELLDLFKQIQFTTRNMAETFLRKCKPGSDSQRSPRPTPSD